MNTKKLLPFTALLVTVLAAPVSFGQASKAEPDPLYELKEPQARTGSILIKDQVTHSEIPLNRTYQELSPQEKAYVHYWYEYIGENDEPPYPAKGLAPIYKAIGRARNIAPGQGELFMAVTVDAKGRAKEVQVLKSPGKQMSEFVASVLLMTKYKPALCDGEPCQMQFPLVVQFKELNNYSMRKAQ